jgi:hypothetical protein
VGSAAGCWLLAVTGCWLLAAGAAAAAAAAAAAGRWPLADPLRPLAAGRWPLANANAEQHTGRYWLMACYVLFCVLHVDIEFRGAKGEDGAACGRGECCAATVEGGC